MVYRAAVLLTHLNVLVREDSDDLIRAVPYPMHYQVRELRVRSRDELVTQPLCNVSMHALRTYHAKLHGNRNHV
jgi:hypothetical protein